MMYVYHQDSYYPQVMAGTVPIPREVASVLFIMDQIRCSYDVAVISETLFVDCKV